MKQTSIPSFFRWHHNKGRAPWNKGKTNVYSEETQRKRSETLKGRHLSDETKRKLSIAQNGPNNVFYGRKHTKETKRKISEILRGRPGLKGKLVSEETRKRMRGRVVSEETRKRMSKSLKGRKTWNKGLKNVYRPSEETKKKQSEVNKGQIPWNKGLTNPYSEEARQKMIEVLKIHGKQTQFPKGNVPNYRHPKGFIPWNKGHSPSEETRRKLSKSLMGELKGPKHPMYGKHPTEETLKKLRAIRAKQTFPKKDTKIEVKIQQQLKALEIDFMAHHWMNIQHAYQCDIYIPAWNAVIECDGTYWHKYPMGREIDHLRTRELMEKGYKVLRLWEHEIKEMTTEDLKRKLEEVVQTRVGDDV